MLRSTVHGLIATLLFGHAGLSLDCGEDSPREQRIEDRAERREDRVERRRGESSGIDVDVDVSR